VSGPANGVFAHGGGGEVDQRTQAVGEKRLHGSTVGINGVEVVHGLYHGHGPILDNPSGARVFGDDIVGRKGGHVGPFLVGFCWVSTHFDGHLVKVAEFTMSQSNEHVGQTRGDTNVPEDDAGAIRERIRRGFTEREVNNSVSCGVEFLQDFVADGARDHVDDDVSLTVVGGCSITEMEGGRCLSRHDVVQMDLQPRDVELASDKRTDQPSAQTVNPHSRGFGHRASKVPAPPFAAWTMEEVVMCCKVEREP